MTVHVPAPVKVSTVPLTEHPAVLLALETLYVTDALFEGVAASLVKFTTVVVRMLVVGVQPIVGVA
jgi:hypothetical protein